MAIPTYPAGFRLVTGDSLNVLVAALNALPPGSTAFNNLTATTDPGAGGITIADSAVVAQNGGAWVMSGSLFKRGATGSNTQVAVPGGVILSGSHVGASAAVQEVTATESGAILIAITGNATTAATDIIGSFFEVNAMN